MYTRPSKPESFLFEVCGGGQLRIYNNLVSETQQTAVTEELMQCSYFRQYTIQNNPEPRAHFLLHDKATNDFDGEDQPGYRYGSIRMKGRPLSLLPHVQQLAKDMEATLMCDYLSENIADESMVEFGACFWNVGVNPVLYRDGRDRIGFHADDDQGEQLILSALVSSPADTTRRISIRSRRSKKSGNVEGDEQFELFLDAGDAYSMDGVLQKHYEHGVPSDQKSVDGSPGGQQKRIAIVFRRGQQVDQQNDSGQSFASLQPRIPVPHKIGSIQGLHEGLTYTRVQLNDMYAHRSQQRGISGNQLVGCDAIIVSGLRHDGLGNDQLFRLDYAASSKEGALSVLKSYIEEIPIRVFRSSVLRSPYKALSKSSSPACYRYDGLYKVELVHFFDESSEQATIVECPEKHLTSRIPSSRVYLFHLTRIDDGVGLRTNRLSSEEFLRQSIKRKTMLPEAKKSLRLQVSKGKLINGVQHSLPKTLSEPHESSPEELLLSSLKQKTSGKRKKERRATTIGKKSKSVATVSSDSSVNAEFESDCPSDDDDQQQPPEERTRMSLRALEPVCYTSTTTRPPFFYR